MQASIPTEGDHSYGRRSPARAIGSGGVLAVPQVESLLVVEANGEVIEAFIARHGKYPRLKIIRGGFLQVHPAGRALTW